MVKFRHILSSVIVFGLIVSCAAIPAKKINLMNYPEINHVDKNDLNLSYKIDAEASKQEPFNIGVSFNRIGGNQINISRDFNNVISQKFSSHKMKKSENSSSDQCKIKFSSKKDEQLDGICGPYYLLSSLTIFIIPYYCINHYQANASLISYPKGTETHGRNIALSINQAKLGDYFLDENDRPAKLLKTYELKDKVHEVWSLLWMLSWFVYNPESVGTPEGAKKLTEDTISEALVHSILSDASTFEECKKDQPSSRKKK